jgi:putative protein-disulfide isomerase
MQFIGAGSRPTRYCFAYLQKFTKEFCERFRAGANSLHGRPQARGAQCAFANCIACRNIMELHYIFDPLCGWCYGASTLVETLAQRLPAQMPLRLWPGALFPEPVELEAGMRAHIVSADQRIAQLTGVEFGEAYLARVGNPANAVTLWSVPVIAAIAAAPQEAQLDMLYALQRAHYVQGRDLADMATLAEVARESGLDGAAFDARMRDPAHAQATSQWISQARALMARTGAGGFPSFSVEKDGKMMRVDHQSAYADPEALAAQLAEFAQQG